MRRHPRVLAIRANAETKSEILGGDVIIQMRTGAESNDGIRIEMWTAEPVDFGAAQFAEFGDIRVRFERIHKTQRQRDRGSSRDVLPVAP